MNRSAAIVAEARRWLGTPYHHQADVRGVGVDCAMLLVRVYHACGLIPAIEPRPYPPDWHLHRSTERYLGWVEDYAEPVDVGEPGDVALYRFGRCLSHGGIVIKESQMIHAFKRAGKVEVAELCTFEPRLAGFWRVKS
ncbi:MAG TPA: NlpC/P60 family protein [Gammaproteobacteria bacterium]|nr:NlpC/P60 family protein [Gammaproteobacteria bacterium]